MLPTHQVPRSNLTHSPLNCWWLASTVTLLQMHQLVREGTPPLPLGHSRIQPDAPLAIRGRRDAWCRTSPDDNDVDQAAQLPPRMKHDPNICSKSRVTTLLRLVARAVGVRC